MINNVLKLLDIKFFLLDIKIMNSFPGFQYLILQIDPFERVFLDITLRDKTIKLCLKRISLDLFPCLLKFDVLLLEISHVRQYIVSEFLSIRNNAFVISAHCLKK